MQRTEERTIEDQDGKLLVKSTQLPALRAFKLMAKLGKLLGPSIGQLRGAKLGDDKVKLLPALMALFENLDEDTAAKLAVQVLEGTLVVDGNRAVTLSDADKIDSVFGGRLLAMLKVMAFAIEVNFRDFLKGLGKEAEAKKPDQLATEPAASPSP